MDFILLTIFVNVIRKDWRLVLVSGQVYRWVVVSITPHWHVSEHFSYRDTWEATGNQI